MTGRVECGISGECVERQEAAETYVEYRHKEVSFLLIFEKEIPEDKTFALKSRFLNHCIDCHQLCMSIHLNQRTTEGRRMKKETKKDERGNLSGGHAQSACRQGSDGEFPLRAEAERGRALHGA